VGVASAPQISDYFRIDAAAGGLIHEMRAFSQGPAIHPKPQRKTHIMLDSR